MNKRTAVILLVCLGTVTLGCFLTNLFSGQPEIDNSPQMATPTTELPEEETQEATPTLEESEPPAPTRTPTLSEPTPTPTPESLNGEGPYLVFGGKGGVWVSNPDGTFLTQLFTEPYHNDLRTALSPDGQRLALVSQDDTGIYLNLIGFPNGISLNRVQLLEGVPDTVGPKAWIAYAIKDYNSIAWQPGSGSLLAFVGGMEGPTADIYTLNTETGVIAQLTEGPSQAIQPTWSPDGKYILHFGVSWVPPFGGAIVGHNRMDDAWLVDAEDGAIFRLPKPVTLWPNFIGWRDSTHYLACEEDSLKRIRIPDGDTETLFACCCAKDIVFSPEHGSVLLNMAPGCNDALDEGLYLLPADAAQPVRIYDSPGWEMHWLPESDFFYSFEGLVLSADGSQAYAAREPTHSFDPAVSPLGYVAWVVYKDYQSSIHLMDPQGNWEKILEMDIRTYLWDPITGEQLIIVLENGTLIRAAMPDFEAEFIDRFDGSVSEAMVFP